MGALLGFDPRPYTLRELVAMTDAKVEADWDHTAALRMDIRNSAANVRKVTKFRDVHPCRKKTPSKKLNKKQSKKLLNEIWARFKD